MVNTFRARSTVQRIHGYYLNKIYTNPALEASKKIYNEKQVQMIIKLIPLTEIIFLICFYQKT